MKKFKKRKGVKPLGLRNDKMYDAPPSDFSVQEIPRSLKEFILLKESAKDPEHHRQKVKSFSTKSAIQERSTKSTIQNKLSKSNTPKVSEHKRSSSLKKQTVVDSEPVIESNIIKSSSKIKQKKKKKFLKLKEKREQKKLQSKRQKEEDKVDFAKDSIKFGETVHRPPQLSVLPRKVAQSGFQNRPGRKDDLLLKSLLKRKHSK